MDKMVTKHRTGYLYTRGSSGVYYLEYTLGGNRVKKALHNPDGTPITKRRDAETERIRIMSPLKVANPAEMKSQMPGAPVTGAPAAVIPLPEKDSLAIAGIWSSYVASQARPDSGSRTLDGYSRQVRLFVAWLGEQHPECTTLATVTPAIAEEYSSYLLSDALFPVALRTRKRKAAAKDDTPTPKKAFTGNTFNKHIRVLELVFRVLQRKTGVTSLNPWSGISRKTENQMSRRELTVEEINTIVNNAHGELRSLLLLGIYTGMRLGDCCTLRWSEVDLARKIILRVPNKTARRKNQPVHIPIHPTLLAVMAETPQSKRKGDVLPEMAGAYRNNNSEVCRALRKHFTSCGIQIHGDGTGYTTVKGDGDDEHGKRVHSGKRAVVEVGFHSLRHSFVSLCRAANTPLAVVEAIVGHSNPAMTRHYTHVGDLAASQAVASLPALGVTDGQVVQPPSGLSMDKRSGAHGPKAKNLFSERDQKMVAILGRSSSETWKKDCDALLDLLRGQ